MTDITSTPFELPAEGGHAIHGTVWPTAECAPTAVVQIFHGLGEHHGRYARFARAAVAHGFAVVAHDHRGHGAATDELGFFSRDNGWQRLSDDGVRVNDLICERFPDTPVMLLGHSMGSYLAQFFVLSNPGRIDALILSASTWPAKTSLFPGKCIAQIEAWRMGIYGKSALLDRLGFGNFNKRFKPARTAMDWLSRDNDEVDAYIDDPLCGGPYSCGLWLDLLGGLMNIASDDALQRISSDLPILFTGGANDPVGGDRGITRLAMHYAQTGHSRLTVKIYDGGRHEMLNETNRDDFSADLLGWIDTQLPAKARA